MDYNALSGAGTGFVTFLAGDSAGQVRSINIIIVDDSLVEESPDEFFFVTGTESADFAEFVGGGNSDTVTVNILDNDSKFLH